MKNTITPLNQKAQENGKNEPTLTWAQLMWKNSYLQLFALAVVALTVELFFWDEFYSLSAIIIGLSIPIGMMVMIAYKGFYQFWNDYKNGRSR